MHEGGHDITGAGAGDAAMRRHLAEVADLMPDARIGFRLHGDQRIPVAGIGNVLEQIDWWVDGPDDPVRVGPLDKLKRSLHQPPRSASR